MCQPDKAKEGKERAYFPEGVHSTSISGPPTTIAGVMDGKTNGDVVLGVSLLDGAPPKQSLGLGVGVIKVHQDPNGDSPW